MRKTIVSLLMWGFLILGAFIFEPQINAAGDPGLSGYTYIPKTNTQYEDITFTHIAENNSSTVDTVSYNVSRTKSFGGSLSGEVEADALMYKMKFKAEVSWNVTQSESTTMSWTIPAWSKVKCEYGSAKVYATGTMERWFRGRLTSSRTVNADYSYASYSRKTTY